LTATEIFSHPPSPRAMEGRQEDTPLRPQGYAGQAESTENFHTRMFTTGGFDNLTTGRYNKN